ncbi:MAG: DEAD/DEAH box helicase [Myxococcota bacterium]
MTTAIKLRPYQEDAIASIEAAEGRGVRRQAIQLPTGAGKTIVFADLIARRGGRALVLAHRDELISQAVDKLALIIPRDRIGVVKAEHDDHAKPVVVASVQTLAREHRLARLPRDWTTVVVDEAHHTAAESYLRILDYTVGPDTLLLGVSATLERGDGAGLDHIYDDITYELGILDLIASKHLVDIRALVIDAQIDMSEVKKRQGDYVDRDLEKALIRADAPAHAVRAYDEHATGRRGILFAPTVDAADAFHAAFTGAGYRSAMVWGAQPLEERREVLQDLRKGRLDIVCNCMVLTEGFDEPQVDAIIVARPTCSRPLYVQMIGRGTRTHPGKKDLLVLDLVGAARRHDLITAATLFGVDEATLSEGGLEDAVREQQEREDAVAEAQRLVAEEVDLFRRRNLHWTTDGDQRVYAMSAGSAGIVILAEYDNGWSVLLNQRDGGTESLADGLDIGYAQGVAEDYIRNAKAVQLVDPKAPWRQKAATEKQLATLRKMRVKWDGDLTAGEASDRINLEIARRAVTRHQRR